MLTKSRLKGNWNHVALHRHLYNVHEIFLLRGKVKVRCILQPPLVQATVTPLETVAENSKIDWKYVAMRML